MYKSAKRKLASITLVVGLGFVGISLPYPIFAPMIINNVNGIVGWVGSSHMRAVLLGMLLCAYPLGQFSGSSVLGSLSDAIGRKRSLVLSLTGAFIGYLLSGLAVSRASYALLLLARAFTGFCEGNIAVAQAAAADLSDTLPKSTTFSMINGSIAVGYIVGPLLGAAVIGAFQQSTTIAYALPFFVAAFLILIALLVVITYFGETTVAPMKHAGEPLWPVLSGQLRHSLRTIRAVLRIGSTKHAILRFLLFYISIDLFYEFYPLFFVGKWGFTPVQIGVFSAVYTLPYALSQGLLVPYVGKHFKPLQILEVAGLAAGLAMLLLLIPRAEVSLYWSLPLLGIILSFCSTNTAILVSDAAPEDIQGKAMGVAQSLRVLGIASINIVGGMLGWIHFSAPLWAAAVVMCVTFYILISKKKNHHEHFMG